MATILYRFAGLPAADFACNSMVNHPFPPCWAAYELLNLKLWRKEKGHEQLWPSFAHLVAQALSALCSATSQNFTAVAVCHSFSETVLLFSVELLWLVCSQHRITLLSGKTLQFRMMPQRFRRCRSKNRFAETALQSHTYQFTLIEYTTQSKKRKEKISDCFINFFGAFAAFFVRFSKVLNHDCGL